MGFLKKLFGKKEGDRIVERKGEPDMVYVPNNDELMIWAIEKANLTLGYFENCLKEPKDEQETFSIKVKIVDGDASEHIWLTDPEFDNEGNLFGTIGNEPVDVKNVTYKQKIGVDRKLISDWMIIEDGRLIGGYTIRAIRDTIPDKDKREFDESIGLYIDEGVDYFEHDFTTPEGAILCLEDAYAEKDIDKAIACKDFVTEARRMLKKLKNSLVENDEEMVAQTAEVLKLSFIKYFSENHFPRFGTEIHAFTNREKLNETLYVITEICLQDDNTKTLDKLLVSKTQNGWRVVGIYE